MVLLLATLFATYSKPVTALCAYDGHLYVGLKNGEVEELDSELNSEKVFGRPGPSVCFVAPSPYGLAWLTGQASSIRERQAASGISSLQLHVKSSEGDEVSVGINPKAPVRRLAWLNGRVAVSYDFGSTFFSSHGKQVAADEFFTKEARGLANASLFVRELRDGTELAVFARPYSVRQNSENKDEPLVSLFTAFQVGGTQWIGNGGVASTALDAFPEGELVADENGRLADSGKYMVLSDRVGLTEDGIVAREAGSLIHAPLLSQNWEIARQPSGVATGDSLWFGATDANAWWYNGTALVSQNIASGELCAYMPWLVESSPTCFATSETGVWIGSEKGLRFIADNSLEKTAGFVRVPFGIEATASGDLTAKAMTDAVFAWRFADKERAGIDGGKMIASIFSAAGVKLPQTAAELMEAGRPVTDELRFGDVLLTQKAAGFYLGDGITVQLRGDKVGNGEIWGWPTAKVRRYLP